MLQYIENGDLIIAPNNIKKQLLKEISLSKKILNIKIMTIEEFKNNYFSYADERALYHLMHTYNLNYDVAREYLKYIFLDADIIKPYYEELKKEGLLSYNTLFKKSIKNIKVIGYNTFDKYILDELNKYNITFIKPKTNNYKPKVYEFDTITDEIVFVITKIIEDLKNTDINNICLVNLNDDYKREVRKLFKMFNLPINLNDSINIYSTKTAKDFLNSLKQTKNIEKALENTEKNDIYNKIVDIINKYAFIDIDDTLINIIENEIKKASLNINKLENATMVINIDEMFDPNKHYYVLGFNQGAFPKVYKESGIIPDKIAEKVGVFTSLEKIRNDKEKVINVLSSFPNITITYKLKDNYDTFYPSFLIKEMNLEVKKEKIKLNYSHKYNNLLLSENLDNFINYNEEETSLKSLLATYPNNSYMTYNNAYTGINYNLLSDYLKGKINLSYSSMNNYFLCPFRFYVQNILKLDPFTETFATNLGNVFHDVLAHMYDDDFDMEKIYQSNLEKLNLNAKEKFFMDKLYNTLKFDVETILNQEKYSKFNKALTEKKITIDKSGKLKVTFLGFVDKIKYLEENGHKEVAIIDYKTGFIETNLDNINYGIHLQLPVYAYLVKKGLDDKAKIAGFYLQKLLDNVSVDAKDVESEKKKNLYLNGFTNSDLSVLEKFDTTYENSQMIKSLKVTQKGFSAYSKMINNEEIDKMINIVDEKINEVINAVEKADFKINPIRIDGEMVGCAFCKFKDLCYLKEEDIKDVKGVKFKDIVGGEV